MSLPLWSKHDAEMYRSLSLFPEKLEGQFLGVNEFRSNFRDLHGRPVQDIVEALNHYSHQGYFKYEIKLTTTYLKHGQALNQAETALRALQPEPETPPAVFHGLDEPVHAKVIAEQPLTKAEASSLPDEAKDYLVFKLSAVNRTRLGNELTLYNNDPFPAIAAGKKYPQGA